MQSGLAGNRILKGNLHWKCSWHSANQGAQATPQTFMANYSRAQILAMEPRVRHPPTAGHPLGGSRGCLGPMWRGTFPAGLGWLGGAVAGPELADGVRAAEERSTKASPSAVSGSSLVPYNGAVAEALEPLTAGLGGARTGDKAEIFREAPSGSDACRDPLRS